MDTPVLRIIQITLMDRQGLDSRKGKRPASWLQDDKKHHHAEYLKRLADLRDDLIGQEKSNLAHALDRLRLSSITNTDSIYRLRLRDARSFPSPRRQMITTSEKFRQTRPVKPRPQLFPLQGKQLIEPTSNRTTCPEEKEEKQAAQIDEIAQFNLRRFAQPTSSIPNIGRKAGKREDLVLNTKGMNKRKSKSYPQTYFNSLSQSCSSTKRCESVDLRPESFKLQSLTEGDRLDEERLRKFYYVYYVPSSTSASSQMSEEKSSPRLFKKQTSNSKVRRPIRHGSERSMTSLEMSKNSARPIEFRLPVVRVADNKYTLNQTVPAFNVHEELERIRIDKKGIEGNDLEVGESDELSGRLSRRHIRIDMPAIICNCPTPDPRDLEEDTYDAGTLSKMYRQSEIRQRELRNLFEDVRELNMRTDTLTHCEQIYVENE